MRYSSHDREQRKQARRSAQRRAADIRERFSYTAMGCVVMLVLFVALALLLTLGLLLFAKFNPTL